MARFFTDFDEYSVGDVTNEDWTSISPSNDWEFVDIGSGDIALEQNTNGGGDDQAVIWDEPGTDEADIEIYAQGVPGNNNSSSFELFTRAAPGSGVDEVGYRLDWDPPDNELRLRKKTESGQTELVTVGFNHSTGDTINAVFRVNGTTIQAKTWIEGNAEPSSWDIDETDSDLASGGAGVHNFDSRPGPQWLKFGVGTRGDEAPREAVLAWSASGQGKATGTAELTLEAPTVDLAATGAAQADGLAKLTKLDNLPSATGQVVCAAACALTALLPLAVTGPVVSQGTAALTSYRGVSGFGEGVATGTAALTVEGEYAASGVATATGSAALTAFTDLVASGTARGGATASVVVSTSVSAQGNAKALAQASLNAYLVAVASGSGIASGTATLNTGQLNVAVLDAVISDLQRPVITLGDSQRPVVTLTDVQDTSASLTD